MAGAFDNEPAVLDTAALAEITENITEIIGSGTDQDRKALVETFIAEIKITSLAAVVPVFHIPTITRTGPHETRTRP